MRAIWMIFAALWLSLFLGMSVGLGRLTYHAWTAQREGRVSRQAVCWLIGQTLAAGMLALWGFAAAFILPRHLTDVGSGLLTFYIGCTLLTSWYPGCRYRRYLKGPDVGALPPPDARHRSLSLWLTCGTYWLCPLPLGMVIGGLYTFFTS